jgi:hypothetical protein
LEDVEVMERKLWAILGLDVEEDWKSHSNHHWIESHKAMKYVVAHEFHNYLDEVERVVL